MGISATLQATCCGFAVTPSAFRKVALRCICKRPPGVTPRAPFYALAARGTTSARRAFSFSRSAGVIRRPCQRRETSTSTAWISDNPARSSGIELMTFVRRRPSSISRSKARTRNSPPSSGTCFAWHGSIRPSPAGADGPTIVAVRPGFLHADGRARTLRRTEPSTPLPQRSLGRVARAWATRHKSGRTGGAYHEGSNRV